MDKIGRYGTLLFICLVLLTSCVNFFEPVPGQTAAHTVTGPVSGPIPAGTQRERVTAAKKVPPERFLTPEVETLTAKVRRNPGRHLEGLVRALTEGIDDPFLRVKAIHDWIAYNIDYDSEAFLGGQPRIVEPYAVLERGSTVCQGYSELFHTMAAIAGIRSVMIQGYSRGYGWNPYIEPEKPEDLNHAWNGVEIDGGWYLIDNTWDAGHLGAGNVYTRNYETGYFCTDPKIFLSEHFPDDPRWQLLEEPFSFEEFHGMPAMNGRCDELGITLVSDLGALNRVKDRAEIVLRMPEDVYASAHLMVVGGESDGFGYPTFWIRDGDTETHLIAFPKPGRYFLSMGAGKIRADGTREPYAPALSGYFDVDSAAAVTYPRLDPEFSAAGLRLVLPRVPYDPKVADPVEVVIAGGPPDTNLAFELFEEPRGSTWQPLKNRVLVRKEGASWRAKASLPKPGLYTLSVFRKVSMDDKSYQLFPIAWFPLETTVSMSREYPVVYSPREFAVRYPIHSPLERESSVAFEVASRGGREVFIGVGGRIEPLSGDAEGVYTGTYAIVGDTAWLYYLDEEQDCYMLIAEYEVR